MPKTKSPRAPRQPAARTKAPRSAVRAAMAQVKAATMPRPVRVHITEPLPPRHWAVDHRQAQGLLAHSLEAEQTIMTALGIWPIRPLPSWIEESGFSYTDFWHTALAESDAARIAAQETAIAANNAEIAALANGLSLDVKVSEASEAKDAISHTARVLRFDALAMAKRIEAAGAKHKNKARGRAENKNRHLAYRCPVCSTYNEKRAQWSNTIRCSAPDRIVMCAGRHGAEHAPALCEFIEESQPDYRLADAAAGISNEQELVIAPTATINPHFSRSLAKLTANKAAYAAALTAPTPKPAPAPASDDKSEFGF